jgi:hypothetical protein
MDGSARAGGKTRRRRGVGVAVSVAVHAAAVFAVVSMHAIPPKQYDPPAIDVALVTLPPPKPPEPPTPVIAPAPPTPVKAEKPTPPKAAKVVKVEKVAQHHTRVRPSPPRPSFLMLAADPKPAADPGVELSEGEIAGAVRNGGGDGGGGGGSRCDMTRRIQETLRKDPMVQEAIARYAGKAVRVWNGDWMWFQGDDGKGLTAVRQAMMWEIAFSPAECKHQSMHGLVLLSASDRNGSARLAVGGGAWRWSDLLVPHPGVNGGEP